MEFKDAEYVVAISETQSITKAAERLYLSQPALSLYLKNLEHRLGLRLFDRVGKKFVLTYAGVKFVEESRKLLQIRNRLDDEIRDILKSDKGLLRVGLPLLRGITLLPMVLPEFRKEYPNVQVRVFEEDASQLEAKVLAGEIDLAFFNRPIRNRELNHILISSEEIVLCAPPGHPLEQRAVCRPGCNYPWVDIRACRDEDFLVNFPSQRTWQVSRQIFQEAGFEPRVTLQLKSLMTTVALCARGYGLCVASERYVRDGSLLPGVRPLAFSIGDPALTMNLVASHRKDAHLTLYAKCFIRLCQEQYKI